MSNYPCMCLSLGSNTISREAMARSDFDTPSELVEFIEQEIAACQGGRYGDFNLRRMYLSMPSSYFGMGGWCFYINMKEAATLSYDEIHEFISILGDLCENKNNFHILIVPRPARSKKLKDCAPLSFEIMLSTFRDFEAVQVRVLVGWDTIHPEKLICM